MLLLLACTNGGPGPRDRDATESTPPDSAVDSEPLVEWCSPEAPALPDNLYSTEWRPAPYLPAGDIVQLVESQDGTVIAGSALSGLFESSDGINWLIQTFSVTHVYGQLALHPTDSSYVAYASQDLELSKDGGDSYTRVKFYDEPAPGTHVRGVAFHDGRVLSATEAGVIWAIDLETDVVTELGTLPETPPHTSKVLENTLDLAVAGAATGAIYAHGEGADLHRSDDGGETWAAVRSGQHAQNTLHVDGDDVWVVDKSNEIVVWHSPDAGESWSRLGDVPTTVYDLTVQGDTVWLAADASLYKSLDGDFARVDVDVGHYFTSVHALADGALLAGHSTGIARSEDGGETWVDASDGLIDQDAAIVADVPECPGTLLQGTRCRSGLYMSTDWGQTFARVDEYLHYVMVVEPHPRRRREIWASSDEAILQSTDFGATWSVTKVSYDELGYGYHVHGLAAHPSRQCEVLVGSVGSGIWNDSSGKVYKTTDCGETWVDSSDGVPQSEASVHAFQYVEDDTVLMGTYRGGDIGHSGDPGVGMFRSTDAGESWTQVGPDEVQDVPYFAMCGDRVYAATDVGVLGSDDGGATWSVLDEASADEQVLAIDCHEDDVLALRFNITMRRSRDGGATWEDATEGLPTPTGQDPEMFTSSVTISQDGQIAWAATGGGGMHWLKLE